MLPMSYQYVIPKFLYDLEFRIKPKKATFVTNALGALLFVRLFADHIYFGTLKHEIG